MYQNFLVAYSDTTAVLFLSAHYIVYMFLSFCRASFTSGRRDASTIPYYGKSFKNDS
jgi:hypothetical protein